VERVFGPVGNRAGGQLITAVDLSGSVRVSIMSLALRNLVFTLLVPGLGAWFCHGGSSGVAGRLFRWLGMASR
jgi:hypothetical protein